MHRLLVLIFAALALCSPAWSQDGIYADFQTSLGNFTCQLHYDRAPKTVANFIALATGERAWLDLPTGDAKRRPFYNGLTFHRVVSGFVIQGGSPNGQGTDGPGYTFKDEFHPTLRHDAAGVLSMANSGLHSNGSQFFVTLAATTHLNDVHSVFGNVTSGLSVVQAIGSVATNANGKPITPVVMQSVNIRRVGTAAQAFNIQAQGLPTVRSANPKLVAPNASTLQLEFNRAQYSEYSVFNSADLATWNRTRLGLYESTPPTGPFDVSAVIGQPKHSFRVSEVAYPAPIFTPSSIAGRTLTLDLGGGTTIQYVISPAGTGTSTLNLTGSPPSTGTITGGSWSQEAYRGRLYITCTNIVPLDVSLVFSNANPSTSGIFKGTANNTNPISGSFTSTVP